MELHGLTLTGGDTGGLFPNDVGGAIFNHENLTLTSSTLSGNSAINRGGGIYSNTDLTTQTTTIVNTTKAQAPHSADFDSDQLSASPWQPVVASTTQDPALDLRTELRGAALALVIAEQRGLPNEIAAIDDGLNLETPYEAV